MGKEPENKYGVKFSELHAIDLVDMDGDGLKDIVTGKRFWSHGRIGRSGPQLRRGSILVQTGSRRR